MPLSFSICFNTKQPTSYLTNWSRQWELSDKSNVLLNECLNEHERAQNKKLTCLALFTASYLPPPRSAVDVRPVNIRERYSIWPVVCVCRRVCPCETISIIVCRVVCMSLSFVLYFLKRCPFPTSHALCPCAVSSCRCWSWEEARYGELVLMVCKW